MILSSVNRTTPSLSNSRIKNTLRLEFPVPLPSIGPGKATEKLCGVLKPRRMVRLSLTGADPAGAGPLLESQRRLLLKVKSSPGVVTTASFISTARECNS